MRGCLVLPLLLMNVCIMGMTNVLDEHDSETTMTGFGPSAWYNGALFRVILIWRFIKLHRAGLRA